MLLGHWLEMASVENAQGALNELAKLLPDEAELLERGKSRTVPVNQLKVGDMILLSVPELECLWMELSSKVSLRLTNQ